MKILEEKQKTKIYLKYVYRGDKKIKNEEIKKNIKIHQKLERGISQECSSSYKQATTQAKK